MSLSSEMLGAIGAVIAAIVAGLVAFIVSVLTKEQKTSEFRQAWIDALRGEIADYIAKNYVFLTAVKVQGNRKHTNEELGEYLIEKRIPEMSDIEAMRARILLRMNPKEHQKIITLINNIYGKAGVATDDGFNSTEERIEALLKQSQEALKEEWQRVKKGEPVFFWTKWLSLCFAILAIAVGISFFNNHWKIAPVTPDTTAQTPLKTAKP